MKSTEVQKNPALTAYLASTNARARKLATSRVVACQFSLQHGLAASVGIVFGKAECC